jgi:hypothetical protein
MIPLTITPNIEKAPWTELKGENVIPGLGRIIKIGRLPKGTTEGRSTVSVLIQMPDGKILAAETTLRLMESAVRTLTLSAAADEG